MYCWSSWSFLIYWKWKHSVNWFFSLQAFHDLIFIIYRCIRVWTRKNVVDFNLLIKVENIYWSLKKELLLSTCVQWRGLNIQQLSFTSNYGVFIPLKYSHCQCNVQMKWFFILTNPNYVICYLIKQKNVRVHQKSTCNSHTLFLTARQLHTSFTNMGFISFLSLKTIK